MRCEYIACGIAGPWSESNFSFLFLLDDCLRGRSGLSTTNHARNTVSNSSESLLNSLFSLLSRHIPNEDIPYPEPMHRNDVRPDLLLRHRLGRWIDRMVGRVERGFDLFHGFPLWNRVVRHRCGVVDAFPQQCQCLRLGWGDGFRFHR